MRDPQAAEADEHAADAHEAELEAFTQPVALRRAERPVAVAQPVGDDRDARRDDLRDERPLVQILHTQDGEDEGVEHRDVDDKSDEPNDPEFRELGYE